MRRHYLLLAGLLGRWSPVLLVSALLAGPLPSARAGPAHPVPRRAHDRTIVVKLAPDRVTVEYRLEVDEFTVVYDDLPAVSDQIDLTRLTKPDEFYDLFTRSYAPVLAANLIAKVDGESIAFTCTGRAFTLQDEEGNSLGHLRCDFQFQALWTIAPDKRHDFHFRESNYELEDGRIRLSLQAADGIVVQHQVEPDPKLQLLTPSELKPGDDAKLRTATAIFRLSEASTVNPERSSAPS